jgi:nucleoside phosphorylase/tetratricopeptide (TPR) repeat protein
MAADAAPAGLPPPTIGIVTALPTEFAAVKAMMDGGRDDFPTNARGNRPQYYLGQMPAAEGSWHTVVLALAVATGNNEAAIYATNLARDYSTVQAILMVGIAGAVPNPKKPDDHVRLGDVVVSDEHGVVQYDLGKDMAEGFTANPTQDRPAPGLLHGAKRLQAGKIAGQCPWVAHIARAKDLEGVARPAPAMDVLYAWTKAPDGSATKGHRIRHPRDDQRRQGEPRVFLGPIASSNSVQKDPFKRDALRDKYGVKAVEMEGSGVADASWVAGVGYLVVRGTCDYCDPEKNDIWRGYAAVIAAAYARALLEAIPAAHPSSGAGGGAPPGPALVISRENAAVSRDALIITNGLTVPRAWAQPPEPLSPLARRAVGRKDELADLHHRLAAEGSAAVVSRGPMAALHGEPGMGKSTLAALYAERYAGDYPGGVLWVQLNPGQRTAESVNPELRRLARLALEPEASSQGALASAQFAPEIVRQLLGGHGRLLVIIDNVWDERPLEALKRALPEDAAVLLTTRDYGVAYALAQSKRAIVELKHLSPPDARLLLQDRLPDLAQAPADALAGGLGRHAQALDLAARALACRGAERYEQAIDEILRRVREGRGFGDLPTMRPGERVTEVEIALKYSYDYLGELKEGAECQRRFRALGALAPDASFEQGAAAALWGEEQARECLDLFRRLALISDAEAPSGAGGGRFQQHAILRAYALYLQGEEERAELALRHAEHYLARMRTEDDAQRYYLMAPELPNLRHAFEWAAGASLPLAQGLLGNCANLLKSQNLGLEYLHWATRALARAREEGEGQAIGWTLGSYGNALQAAATVATGEDRAARLQEALRAYDEALELRRGVPLDYATTQNNRAALLWDLEDFAEALKALWDAEQGFERAPHAQYTELCRQSLYKTKAQLGKRFKTLWDQVVHEPQPDWLQKG